VGRELFQRVVMNRLRTRYPRVHVTEEQDLAAVLFVGGERIALALADLFERAEAAPEARDRLIDAHLAAAVREHVPRSDDFAQIRRRVLPMLKHPDFVEESRRLVPEKALHFRPFAAGLQIAYVVDDPNALRYINGADLGRWRVTPGELDAIACDNLVARSPLSNLIAVGEGASRLFIFNSGDGYDATRILLSDRLREFARQVAGRLVVGIPNRDFLIAFGDTDRQLLERVRWQVKRDNHSVDSRLTDRLLTLAGESIEEYAR